ncbi:hypothetical protein CAXC1_150054 [Candidatus Xenohaliotis californiensis]|uniref:Uncharacterized protein n=1 Tax=Candidatus Xenohaliotis californiensis TaxID=84677 RepID=A0ABM9N7B3_9RICK|nr:hypothetical protein CAXC1_150054 [Candidatus Xenohaliotis californiensis]
MTGTDHSAESTRKFLEARYGVLSNKIEDLKTAVGVTHYGVRTAGKTVDTLGSKNSVYSTESEGVQLDPNVNQPIPVANAYNPMNSSAVGADGDFSQNKNARELHINPNNSDNKSTVSSNDSYNTAPNILHASDVRGSNKSTHYSSKNDSVSDVSSVASSLKDRSYDVNPSSNDDFQIKPWRLIRAKNDLELAQQSVDSIIRSNVLHVSLNEKINDFLEDAGNELHNYTISLLQNAESDSLESVVTSDKENSFIVMAQRDFMQELLHNAAQRISNRSLSWKVQELCNLLADKSNGFGLINEKFNELSTANAQIAGNDSSFIEWLLEENNRCINNALGVLHNIRAVSVVVELQDSAISRLTRSLSRMQKRDQGYFTTTIAQPVLEDYALQSDVAVDIWNKVSRLDDHGYVMPLKESTKFDVSLSHTDDGPSEFINSDDIQSISSGNLQVKDEVLMQEAEDNIDVNSEINPDIDESKMDKTSDKFVNDYLNTRPYLAGMVGDDELMPDIKKDDEHRDDIKVTKAAEDSLRDDFSLDSDNIHIDSARTLNDSNMRTRK